MSPLALHRLYDLPGLDAQGRALAARIRRIRSSATVRPSARRAFAARIRIGSDLVQLIAHDPRLPPEIWGARDGMQELARAYAEFEETFEKQSAAFLDAVLDGDRGEAKGKP